MLKQPGSAREKAPMIKFFQCIRRREDVSPADFVRFWSQYREAVDAVGEATQAVRVTASRTLAARTRVTMKTSEVNRRAETPKRRSRSA
jgi:hypothetical protein